MTPEAWAIAATIATAAVVWVVLQDKFPRAKDGQLPWRARQFVFALLLLVGLVVLTTVLLKAGQQ